MSYGKVLVSPGAGEPIVSFPTIESIATAGWSAPTEMEDQGIHVWGFSLDGSLSFVEQCRSWLSEEERERAARFIRREDHFRFVLAHGGLRAVLARYAGLHPSTLTFQPDATGKPALLNGYVSRHPLRFNLSHSHGRMLMAISNRQDVGVDLEQIRDKVEAAKLAERFYAPTERERVLSLSGPGQTQRFYRYWVAKEAVLKGQAVGLRALQQCEILTSDNSPRAEVKLSEGATMQSGWTIHWLDCGAGWVGAVSACGSDWAICIKTSA
jgi:4'-phosphopantetheinyl transferase